MYELLGSPTSRAFRVMWMLEELGQPYTMTKAAPQSEEVRVLNPSGKVPVFKDGEDVITDSSAIITYLADKHGALTAPAGTVARGQQDAMTQCILDEIDAVLWTAARHGFILPEDKRVPEVKTSLKWEYERNLDRIMKQAKGPYLMGDEFTVPDIILAHCGAWAKSAKFPSDNEDFKIYLKACRSRDAFQKLTAG
ncbi:glutathione S-transferase [Shimia gijangensis]|uniref:Glutathione S-transferase n=1 Tax=Shimia gijangensis TaxID=1470563 RepID=A0A1M6NNR3_9RHOB|nr:glutathione S-transferase family protein [Shimia gijangensis]SHJ97340.1 glutathione S-transferase [Shimia gijangensis]